MPGDLLNTAFDPDPDTSYLQVPGAGTGAGAGNLVGSTPSGPIPPPNPMVPAGLPANLPGISGGPPVFGTAPVTPPALTPPNRSGGGTDWAKLAKLLGSSIGGGGGGAGAPTGSGRMLPAQMPLTSLNRPLPQPAASADAGNTQELIAYLSEAIRRAQAANTLTNQPQR